MNFISKQFELKTSGKKSELKAHHQVIVVGAGPVGLTLAIDLASHGVDVVLIDRRDRILNSSRAVGIRRRAMQVFDRIGVADEISAKAIPFVHSWAYFGVTQIDEILLASGENEKHPELLLLQQCWIEQALVDRALTCGVDIRWHCKVVQTRDNSNGSELDVETVNGNFSISSDYVVAADGAHSEVRRLLGLRYEGKSFEQQWAIIDFHMPTDLPRGRRVWFDPPYSPNSTTLLHRLPFDVWRLDYLVPDCEDAVEAAEPKHARERVMRHLDMMGIDDPWTLLDTSVYRPNALSMTNYRSGSVFFIGDAAHLLPIFSGRGMNHGIEDAANLSWKLIEVLMEGADSKLLDSYDAERRPAVLATLKEVSKTTIYMNGSSKGVRLLRQAVLSLAISQPFARALFEPFSIEESKYLESYLNHPSSQEGKFNSGPQPGIAIPDFEVADSISKNRVALHDRLGDGFCLLLAAHGYSAEKRSEILEQLMKVAPKVRVVSLVSEYDRSGSECLCVDVDGMARPMLNASPGTVYLLRPDRVVVSRWKQLNIAEIGESLKVARNGLI